MYRKSAKGLLKHIDFIILDLICLELAYYISFFIRQTELDLFDQRLYRNMFVVLFLAQVVVGVFFNTFKNVLKRGYYKEFIATAKNVILTLLISSFYLFITQQEVEYSRSIWIFTICLYFGLSYVTRLLWKQYLKSQKILAKGKRSLLLVTSSSIVHEVIDRIQQNNYEGFYLEGIVLLNVDKTGETIKGIPVVANKDSVTKYASKKWIDEVFVNLPKELPICTELIDKFVLMGIAVHLNISEMGKASGGEQFVEKLSSYTVLTYSINTASMRQVLAKRIMDIVGGFVGCLLTLILVVIVGPMIYIQSPGPIFFAQERVGKNGRKFKLYKFRSMYMDAEERKKELMKQNRIEDGLMFKMENDPRIIGSERGSGKGIGNFIRKTSIDEFPQFWNVLKGEMSLVGTRPPTLGEFELYNLHHRARLAIKPGMTGMWQVSGRSNITNFEEVVKLDVEYIQNWSIALDIKLLFKTVFVAFGGKGSM